MTLSAAAALSVVVLAGCLACLCHRRFLPTKPQAHRYASIHTQPSTVGDELAEFSIGWHDDDAASNVSRSTAALVVQINAPALNNDTEVDLDDTDSSGGF